MAHFLTVFIQTLLEKIHMSRKRHICDTIKGLRSSEIYNIFPKFNVKQHFMLFEFFSRPFLHFLSFFLCLPRAWRRLFLPIVCLSYACFPFFICPPDVFHLLALLFYILTFAIITCLVLIVLCAQLYHFRLLNLRLYRTRSTPDLPPFFHLFATLIIIFSLNYFSSFPRFFISLLAFLQSLLYILCNF